MGPFDNETRLHIPLPEYERGDWFEDEDRNLYIVPDCVAEIEGPDDSIIDRLNFIYRKGRGPTDQELAELGLVRIQGALKRFTPRDGYYHA